MNIITLTFSKEKIKIFLTFLFDLFFLAVVLVWNRQLAVLIDLVTSGQTVTKSIIMNLVVILAAYILMSGATTFVSGLTCSGINYSLRQNYIQKISNQNLPTQKLNGGKEASVLLNELTAVSNFISENLFFMFDSLIKFIGSFGWLIYLNPFLAITSNLPVFFIIIYISFSSKILQKYTLKTNEENSKINSVTDSLMNLFPVIRLYQAQKMILENYSTLLTEWEKLNISMEKKKALLMSISAVITNIPLLLIILIGGKLVIQGKLSLGELYVFISLSGNVSGILMNMPSFIMQFRIFGTNLKKLNAPVIVDNTGGHK
ncbi:MAG: ABC transporter ATP-binding protein [Treponema sp.]|nr:ABC transporter ATP-binding protein [Treponema sp.]